ncbi:MAG: RagB/SusD family nutrient uptake outer membrane protein, partial [Allomuricauda sp.]
MKNMKKWVAFVLMASVLFISCNDDFLNTQPKDSVSSDATWGDGALSQAFVFGIYSALGNAGFEEEGLSS